LVSRLENGFENVSDGRWNSRCFQVSDPLFEVGDSPLKLFHGME
jgi:hypothetical protein